MKIEFRSSLILAFLLAIFLQINYLAFGQSGTGSISGRITDPNGKPLDNVNIVILDTALGTASDQQGNYHIGNLAPGQYTLKFSRIGFQAMVKKILISEGQSVVSNVQLKSIVIPLQEIVVTPGNIIIAQTQSATTQTVEKERITSLPATLDDICRVVQIMPGVSFSDDFCAQFHVRGGKPSENLILLDGIEIFDPYHLKDVGGAVGIMNMDLIDDVSILTGGFPAKYGDRLSSVVSIKNRAGAADRLRGNFSAGGTGLSMVIEGPIPSGSVALSFRKSLLKEAVKILNPTDYSFSPSFYDLQSKIAIQASGRHRLTYNFLYSKDDSYLERWRANQELYADYGNHYHGLVWNFALNPRLSSELILSQGENFWDNRIGKDKEERLNLTEYVLNWNLNFLPTQRHDLELGLTYKHILYDYELKVAPISTDEKLLEELIESYYGNLKLTPHTHKISGYFQDQLKLFGSCYANLGIRYDYFEYNQDQQFSPRIGLAYHLLPKTILRAAWGNYYQAPGYTALARQKGAEHNPRAEQATHYVIGIEQTFSEGFRLRVEAYLKQLDNMIGHYFEFSDQSAQPQLHYGNPNEGRCRGIELFLDSKIGDRISLWGAYAYSKSELEAFFVNWDQQKIEQRKFPRFTDQPHNLSLFINYHFSSNWELNVKWRYLSGLPHTPQYATWNGNTPIWVTGDIYSARYPDYHRLDFRIGKKFNLKKLIFRTFLEIKNLYNRRNIFIYDYKIENGTHVRKAYHSLPFLPTIEANVAF